MTPIYLDYNATTPLDPAVLDAMLPWLKGGFGNPSSAHSLGRAAHDAVEAAAPLGVPGDELHLIPARMKDWTNCRWNSRKAMSSGAAVISVAAVITDQSTPWSTDEKTCRPTVSVRA